MKFLKSYKMQAVAAVMAALGCASCSDTWDEHYAVSSEGVINETLWNAINSNPNLSNFAKVAQACGYDKTLDGSQTFTVFAPTNNSLTSAQADSLISVFQAQQTSGVKSTENTVITQFLKNHIALYKQSVSTVTSDSLKMMNGKYQQLTSTSIGGENFETKNVLYNNGILYTIGGKMTYSPNIYEYLAMDSDLDSVYTFIKGLGRYEFDASQSVAGSIVDGKTQYLDSVMNYKNDFFDDLGYLNSEDSTYWFVAPTNSEWTRLVEEYTPYFNYDTKVDYRDSLQYVHTRRAILSASIFSRTNNPDVSFRDSALSTSARSEQYYTYNPSEKRYNRFYKPFDAGGVFEGTQQTELSNGSVLKASDFRLSKFDTFLQEQIVEAESSFYLDTLNNAIDPMTVRNVSTSNPFYGQVSNNSFVEIIPKAIGVQPNVTYKIPNVLSNVGYDIYVVFAPALAYDTLATAEQRLPVRFRTKVGYQNSGVTLWSRVKLNTTQPDVVDTIQIQSNFKFKTTAYGLGENQAKVNIYTDVPTDQTSVYQTTMRIDCIIVKPHDAPMSEAKKYRISR